MSDGTPGYTLMDAGLLYQLTDSARVTAGLYNLADKEITNDDYGVVLDGRRLNLGLAVDFEDSNPMKRIMAFALAGMTLTGCATTTEVTGSTVISYDHGALDTLLELGLEEKVVAIPHQSLPDYWRTWAQGCRIRWSQTPDLALATDLKPDWY